LVYDQEMPVSINLQTVHPRKLAAVRCEVAPGAVGSAWGPALGKVWEFIRSQPGLRTDGHNIFLYHHSTEPGAPILCDFGVEVTRTFETAGEVYTTETQGGEAAVAVHRGPYHRMNEAHNAIRKWMASNRREWNRLGTRGKYTEIRRRIRPTLRRRSCTSWRIPVEVACARFGRVVGHSYNWPETAFEEITMPPGSWLRRFPKTTSGQQHRLRSNSSPMYEWRVFRPKPTHR
jgi:hypothetical protein